jgi:hypothetical protein
VREIPCFGALLSAARIDAEPSVAAVNELV